MADILPIAAYLGIWGGLSFRGAGGLFSQWAGRDLGDFIPRQIWGIAATFPVILYAFKSGVAWYVAVPSLILCSILTGLMRGTGWSDSLSLGYAGIGKPTSKTWRKQGVLLLHLMVMLSIPFICIEALAAIHLDINAALASVGGWLAASVLSAAAYRIAWVFGGGDLPELGLTPNDPPPLGELLTGLLTTIILTLVALA